MYTINDAVINDAGNGKFYQLPSDKENTDWRPAGAPAFFGQLSPNLYFVFYYL